MTERKRQRNDGLRKVCGCARRSWPKCPHPWHFNFKWNGVSHRLSLDKHVGRRVTNKAEARKQADLLRTKIRAGQLNPLAPVIDALTVAQLGAQFRKEYLVSRRAASLANDTYQLGAINRTPVELPTGEVRPFGDWLAVDVTPLALERFHAVRAARLTVTPTGEPTEVSRTDGRRFTRRPGVRHLGGPVTANRNLGLLRTMFRWAVRTKLLKETPFKYGTEAVVTVGREPPRQRRLDPAEAEALLRACEPRLRALVEAALATGCRIGELLSLQWSQVRFAPPAQIWLQAHKTKTRSNRVVPMSSRLRTILEMRRLDPAGEEHRPEAYVFGDETGRRIASVQTAWAAACRRANLVDLHFHDLRREAGSRWLEGGVPLQTIRDWLGHTNIAQTSTYLSTTLQGRHDAMRRFEEAQAALQPSATGSEALLASGNQAQSETPSENRKTQETVN